MGGHDAREALSARVDQHLRTAQRAQVAANVKQLAGTLWWKAQGSPTPDEALATRDALIAKARMHGLDV